MANSCPPCACHCVGDEGVGRIEMISLFATIGLALFGHWASVLAERRREATSRHLDRIEAQLSQFYGPLRALLARSKVAFSTVIETHWERH